MPCRPVGRYANLEEPFCLLEDIDDVAGVVPPVVDYPLWYRVKPAPRLGLRDVLTTENYRVDDWCAVRVIMPFFPHALCKKLDIRIPFEILRLDNTGDTFIAGLARAPDTSWNVPAVPDLVRAVSQEDLDPPTHRVVPNNCEFDVGEREGSLHRIPGFRGDESPEILSHLIEQLS